MRLDRRHLALGAGALAAIAVAGFAVPRANAAPARHIMAANVLGPPCFPKQLAPGVLPTPRVLDANVTSSFTLYVKQGATTAGGARTYCYVTTPDGDMTYVEAPTIHIRQGGTFRLTLRNMIPPSGPSPAPTPQSTIIDTPDKCAWLPDDSATFPTPNPKATPRRLLRARARPLGDRSAVDAAERHEPAHARLARRSVRRQRLQVARVGAAGRTSASSPSRFH